MSCRYSTSARPTSLREIARRSIENGLEHRGPLELDAADFPPPLSEPGASFVTLRLAGELRGCTGTLAATRPLVCDVSHNAYRSAFGDPRFRPVGAVELPELEVHVAVLGPLEPVEAPSEEALLASLRPGLDGLVLREGPRSATFLPSVWSSLPAPRDFLRHLKLKAGWAEDYWSDDIEVLRYTVESIP